MLELVWVCEKRVIGDSEGGMKLYGGHYVERGNYSGVPLNLFMIKCHSPSAHIYHLRRKKIQVREGSVAYTSIKEMFLMLEGFNQQG